MKRCRDASSSIGASSTACSGSSGSSTSRSHSSRQVASAGARTDASLSRGVKVTRDLAERDRRQLLGRVATTNLQSDHFWKYVAASRIVKRELTAKPPNGLLPQVRQVYEGWIDAYNHYLRSGRGSTTQPAHVTSYAAIHRYVIPV